MIALLVLAVVVQQSVIVNVGPPVPDRHGDPDEAVLSRYDRLWDACAAGVLDHKRTVETAQACKLAADTANSLPAGKHFEERRMANVYAATAYANIPDFKSALPFADHAVDVIREGHVTGSGAEAAYETRSQIKAFSGDLQGAVPDAEQADLAAREMVRGGRSSTQLRKDLEFHAELLRRLDRADEAQKLAAEAAKLPQ